MAFIKEIGTNPSVFESTESYISHLLPATLSSALHHSIGKVADAITESPSFSDRNPVLTNYWKPRVLIDYLLSIEKDFAKMNVKDGYIGISLSRYPLNTAPWGLSPDKGGKVTFVLFPTIDADPAHTGNPAPATIASADTITSSLRAFNFGSLTPPHTPITHGSIISPK